MGRYNKCTKAVSKGLRWGEGNSYTQLTLSPLPTPPPLVDGRKGHLPTAHSPLPTPQPTTRRWWTKGRVNHSTFTPLYSPSPHPWGGWCKEGESHSTLTPLLTHQGCWCNDGKSHHTTWNFVSFHEYKKCTIPTDNTDAAGYFAMQYVAYSSKRV